MNRLEAGGNVRPATLKRVVDNLAKAQGGAALAEATTLIYGTDQRVVPAALRIPSATLDNTIEAGKITPLSPTVVVDSPGGTPMPKKVLDSVGDLVDQMSPKVRKQFLSQMRDSAVEALAGEVEARRRKLKLKRRTG